jgi:hypothetical protein
MKNEKFAHDWEQLTISEETENRILDKIQQKLQPPKKRPALKLKPAMIIAIIFVMLATTVVATAPIIYRMLGSNIGFFNIDKPTHFAGYAEAIKQHSSEVGITVEGDGYALTVDNVAYDGTFLNIFYTLKKDTELALTSATSRKNPYKYEIILANTIAVNIVGHEFTGYNYYYSDSKTEGYLISDFEMKGFMRITIKEDLPDIFDIAISYLRNPESIFLTIDMSEIDIKALKAEPNISAVVTQERSIYYSGVLEHDITIDKVSISPLGNMIQFTQYFSDYSESNGREMVWLFNDFYIVDDKNNFYGQFANYYGGSIAEAKTYSREFHGNVPPDIKYLKLIPYNSTFSYEENFENKDNVKINSLPARFNYSEYGGIIVESMDIIDDEITITYRIEGMTGHNLIFEYYDEDDNRLSLGAALYFPIYDSRTDLYTIKCYSNNAEDIKKINIVFMDIELLEDQTIVIPLQ